MRIAGVVWIMCATACLPLMQPGAAGADGPFTGTFTTQGGSMTLQESGGQVTGTAQVGAASGKVAGTVVNGTLDAMLTMANGQSGRFTAVPSGSGLTVTVPGQKPITLARAGGGAGGAGGEPPSPEIAGTLATTWWHYSASTGTFDSSSSYERTIELCSDGRFFDSSASNASINTPTANGERVGDNGTGIYTGEGGGAGHWTATGTAAAGQLQLVFASGSVESHQYAIRQSGDVDLDGVWYGRSPDKGGQCR